MCSADRLKAMQSSHFMHENLLKALAVLQLLQSVAGEASLPLNGSEDNLQ